MFPVSSDKTLQLLASLSNISPFLNYNLHGLRSEGIFGAKSYIFIPKDLEGRRSGWKVGGLSVVAYSQLHMGCM